MKIMKYRSKSIILNRLDKVLINGETKACRIAVSC